MPATKPGPNITQREMVQPGMFFAVCVAAAVVSWSYYTAKQLKFAVVAGGIAGAALWAGVAQSEGRKDRVAAFDAAVARAVG